MARLLLIVIFVALVSLAAVVPQVASLAAPEQAGTLATAPTVTSTQRTETYTIFTTVYSGEASVRFAAYEGETQALLHQRDQWRTALAAMLAVGGLSVVGAFGAFQVLMKLRRKHAAEVALALRGEEMRQRQPGCSDEAVDELPAYSPPLPSYNSLHSTPPARAVALAALAPRAAAQRYTSTWHTITAPSGAFTEDAYIRAVASDDLRRYKLATCLGLIGPCVLLWAFIVYVAWRVHTARRKAKERMNAGATAPA